jgi:hypothetical protein
MVGQTRAVLQRYAASGGSYREMGTLSIGIVALPSGSWRAASRLTSLAATDRRCQG